MKHGYIKDLFPVSENAEERALNTHTWRQEKKKRGRMGRVINKVEASGM